MPVRILERHERQHQTEVASVCIIGAGIAGLLAAARLARHKHRRVVVLESGTGQPDARIDRLNEIDNPTGNYPVFVEPRFRGPGGSSAIWSGKLLPLATGDVLPRPHLNLEGWPFGLQEQSAYLREIETLMRVDRGSYEEDASSALDSARLLARNDPDFVVRWPKISAYHQSNLMRILREEIEEKDNLEIWLGATVVQWDHDPATGRIRSLRAVNHTGKSLTVAAQEYLIAAGALESTRLLLLADRQSNGAITRHSDALGRYFNDHLALHAATLCPRDWTACNLAFSDRSPAHAIRHLHFELRPDVQRAHGIGGGYFDIRVDYRDDSALSRIRSMVGSFRQGKAWADPHNLTDVVRDLPTAIRYVQWRAIHKQRYWPADSMLRIKIWIEQLPHWQNRLYLSDQLDELGAPRLKLDWSATDAEEHAFRVMVEKIEQYWQAHFAPIGSLQWNPIVTADGAHLIDAAEDQAHPAGSTRMGTDPRTSVVDPELRAHEIPNVSVASSSVFPSSGSANPTLTIMQLAMRASDFVARRLTAATASQAVPCRRSVASDSGRTVEPTLSAADRVTSDDMRVP